MTLWCRTVPQTQALWADHELKWTAFAASTQTITLDTVPWPPTQQGQACSHWCTGPQELRDRGTAGVLLGMSCACRQQDAAGGLRQAWKLAALRWHPDKFLAQHGPRIQEGQLQPVQQRLADVWQALQHERRALAF